MRWLLMVTTGTWQNQSWKVEREAFLALEQASCGLSPSRDKREGESSTPYGERR